MRKGKGRPDITEVMFYPGYPSGSNSSFDSLKGLSYEIDFENFDEF